VKNMTAVLLFFFALSLPAFPDSLTEARDWEKKSDYPRALESYRTWLTGNPASPEFRRILLQAARLCPDPGSAAALLDEFLPRAPRGEAAGILAEKASYLEVRGDYAEAQAVMEEAARRSDGEESLHHLLRSAELLLETGDLDRSMEQARAVAGGSSQPALKRRAIFHLARLFAATGDLSEACRLAAALLEEGARHRGDEAILLFLFETAGRLGQESRKKAALDRLAAEYPESPEYRLARLAAGSPSGVKPFPSPSSLLSPPAEGSPPAAGAGKAAVPESGVPAASAPQIPWAVQTGSFSVRENAEYMVLDLKKAGFPAEIREETRPGGNRMHKVVVPLPPDARTDQGTQNLLIRLKERGIEGFLIFPP